VIPFLEIDAEPVYGLSSNVVSPGFSAIISIAMIFGVDFLGLAILNFLKLRKVTDCRWLRWQAIVIGAALLALVLYPMALAGYLSRFNAQIVAITLMCIGVIHIGNILNALHWRAIYMHAINLISTKSIINLMEVIFWFIFIGLGLLALAPVTEADALDYHVGVALHILNTGAFPYSPEWFHSRLAGSGESLIALGLSIGAEQFGSLLQFAGVISFIGIFRHESLITKKWRLICLLSVISTPILVSWVASPKPFLLPIAMTTSALMLTIVMLGSTGSNYKRLCILYIFTLICLLVMTAAVTKLNFMLSGIVVGLTAFIYMVRKGEMIVALIIGIIMAAFIMGPPLIWKHFHYGGSLISALVVPFPGDWPGTLAFEGLLRAHRDSTLSFPISILIPSSLGNITTVLGLGLVIAISTILKYKHDTSKTLIGAALIVTLMGIAIGQKATRFFMEPYLWLIMAAMLRNQSPTNSFCYLSIAGLLAQSVCIIGAIVIGVATLTTGTLTSELRHATMGRHAMGYLEMRWVDSVLPPDAKLIVKSRFIALSPRYSISSDWQSYISNGDTQRQIYEDLTSIKTPDFILLYTQSGEQLNLNKCDGEIFAGPFHTKVATRNPFNSGAPYDVWIIRLNNPGARCDI
jgi:hypothetical protein